MTTHSGANPIDTRGGAGEFVAGQDMDGPAFRAKSPQDR